MIKIVCVGKIKEKYLSDAIEEYKKRLSKYTKLEIIEIADEIIDDKKIALKNEKIGILKVINNRDYIITLDIEGKSIDSIDFSSLINNTFITHPSIVFIIGGSHGLDKEIKDLANCSLSFSKMTFPHQLFRVMLLEQIYRGFKIINNERYHK